MLEKELMDKGIAYIEKEGKKYFSISSLKEKIPDIFIHSADIIEVDGYKYILSNSVRKKTEFDKAIQKIFK